MNAKRGYVPEDERNFSPGAMETMKKASRHVCYLLDEGYDLKQVTVFVGNHFLLSERQRLAIARSIASKNQLAERSRKKIIFFFRKDSAWQLPEASPQKISWLNGAERKQSFISLQVKKCGSMALTPSSHSKCF